MTFPRFELETAPLDQGTVMLEASAGTGKTYTLIGILLRMLLEGQIARLDQALVVTFTIAATEELKTRLRSALARTLKAIDCPEQERDPLLVRLAKLPGARERLRGAIEDFDQVSIATIHGFCKRLLDEAAFESCEPFQLEFVVDPVPMLYRAAADVLRGTYSPDLTVAAALLQGIKLTPQELVTAYRLWQRYPDVRLLPDPADATPHLQSLDAAVLAAAAAMDGELAAQLIGFRWGAKKNPFGADARFSVDRLREQLATAPLLALKELRSFAHASLEKALLKKPPQRTDHAFFAACDEVLTHHDAAHDHLQAALLRRMHVRLEADKLRDHVVSFQDLLSRTHAALHDPARSASLLQSLRQRYHTALIDEFQDTDTLQYGIFATCFANRPLFLVGDPKQSIYGFRGADLDTYLKARSEALLTSTLDTNFRSCGELVRAVGQLFARDDAFVQPGITMPTVVANAAADQLRIEGDDGPALRFRFVAPEDDEPVAKDLAEERIAADTTAEISRLLRSGLTLDGHPLRPQHLAVLTRTNKQAMLVQDELRQHGIMSAIGKAGDVFETEELVELERFLQALLQPGDLARARAAMATRLWGHDAASLAALEDDEVRFDAELARFEPWRRLWIRRGFVVMKEQVLADLGVQHRLLALQGGERRLTNFQQLFELLHDAEHSSRLSPEGLLEWLQHERRHHEELDYQLRELRLESDEDAVQILTVHGSKGLQYEIVFCPFLWDARTPFGAVIAPTPTGRELVFSISSGSPERHAAEAERLAEDVRLCYVALTRAKRRCYVHWGAIGSSRGGSWRSALAWLLSEQRANLIADDGVHARLNWVDHWANRVKTDLPRFDAELARVVAASHGTIGKETVPPEPIALRVAPPPQLKLRPALHPARVVRARALHSFSSLVADATPGDAEPDVADGPLPVVGPPAPGAAQEPPPTGIFGFARGPAAGQCLHTILERIDLARLDPPDEAQVTVTAMLTAAGLQDESAHPGRIDATATVLQNLRDLAAAHVHPGGPTLGALCTGPRLVEWQFTLPTAHSELRHLAQVFARSDSEVARRFAPRLFQLPPRTLRGFLTGFVDLVAEHQGRYWVFDWKSNHLGNQLTDYGPAALDVAMSDHDYVLQYHLYVLALHRHLRQRLPDYDCDRHLGGVCYAFLRGAEPGTSNGMVFDRVPSSLVAAMDQWAHGNRAGGRS